MSNAMASRTQLQWYALTQQANFDRLSLLFFGNAHQDLTEFIKTALGHVRYETYTIRPKSLFNSSEDVANYHAMSAFRQRYSDTEGLTERIRIIRDWYKRAANHQGWKKFRGAYSRLCNKLARDCERADALDDALKIYQQSFRPPARERMARIYRKQGNNKQAYSTLNQMAKDPWNDPETLLLSNYCHVGLLSLRHSKSSLKLPFKLCIKGTS